MRGVNILCIITFVGFLMTGVDVFVVGFVLRGLLDFVECRSHYYYLERDFMVRCIFQEFLTPQELAHCCYTFVWFMFATMEKYK